MAKRELIDRKQAVEVVSNGFDRWHMINLLASQGSIPAITEREIIEPYLEKLKEQVSHCNLCLLVNKEDVLGFIDNLLLESEE